MSSGRSTLICRQRLILKGVSEIAKMLRVQRQNVARPGGRVNDPEVAMNDRGHDEAISEIFWADPLYASELLAKVFRDDNG